MCKTVALYVRSASEAFALNGAPVTLLQAAETLTPDQREQAKAQCSGTCKNPCPLMQALSKGQK